MTIKLTPDKRVKSLSDIPTHAECEQDSTSRRDQHPGTGKPGPPRNTEAISSNAGADQGASGCDATAAGKEGTIADIIATGDET